MIRVFQCEDTLTGILTGVYDAWDSRLGHDNVRLSSGKYENLELFCEYVQVEPDPVKAEKVLRTVRRKMGEEACEMIACASVCPDAGKADAIYRMIVLGLHLPDGREITRMLTRPEVRLVFELHRKAWNLVHHYLGFIRFRELKNGVLFSEIESEADVLALVAPHFADRLPEENWMIYDRMQKKAAIHQAGREFLIVEEVEDEFGHLKDASEEDFFGSLWKAFHRAVCIGSRKNEKLQMSMLPLKFRAFMTEFTE